MENEISKLISRFLPLNEEETMAIIECIPVQFFPKGAVLLKEGQISRNSYFNIKGCVRKFYLIDGEERTTEFFTEEQSIASLQSYTNQTPANHFFECIEDCTLAVLNYDKEQELYKRVDGFESLCRVSLEDDLAQQQQSLDLFITSSPEERYLNLMKTRPDLLNRVPQYHLATYLGVKPESLSRIRKRISRKS